MRPRLVTIGGLALGLAGLVSGSGPAFGQADPGPEVSFRPLDGDQVEVTVTADVPEGDDHAAVGLLVSTEGVTVLRDGAEGPPGAACGFIPAPDGQTERGYDCEGPPEGDEFAISAVMVVPEGVEMVELKTFAETPTGGLQRGSATYTSAAEPPPPPPEEPQQPDGQVQQQGETDQGDDGVPWVVGAGLLVGGLVLLGLGYSYFRGQGAAPSGFDLERALAKPTDPSRPEASPSIMDEVEQKTVIS